MSTTHVLKTWPDFFAPVADGSKNFEVRYDDRGFQAGDTVLLKEWLNTRSWGQETGRVIVARIGYVLHNPVGRRGDTLNGYVAFSLLDIEVVNDVQRGRRLLESTDQQLEAGAR